MDRRAQDSRGGPWPNSGQERLLRAAILRGEPALQAWRSWRAVHDIDTVDPSSQRVLPALYRNLSSQGFDDPLLPRLKGIYRWSWARNQVLFTRAAEAVSALHRAGVELIVLKGAALAHLDYQDAGARPMSDFDFLVRGPDVGRSATILRELGWTPRIARTEELVGVLHAHSFIDHDGARGLDLHWQGLMRRGDDADLWETAVPFELHGIPTLALDPVGRVMHVCLHAAESGDPPAIRWIGDAAAVIRAHPPDWDALIERSRRREVTLVMARLLAHLRERYEVEVPPRVVDELDRTRRARFERGAFAAGMRPRSISAVLRLEWFRYRRLHTTPRWSPVGYARYLRASLGHSTWAGLARQVVRRLVRGPIGP